MEEQQSGRDGDVAGVSALRARIADRVVNATDPDDVLLAALEVICAEGRWAVGHAWIHEPSGAQLLPTHLWHPRDDSFPVFRRASDSRRFEPGEGLPGRSMADRRPLWIPDLAADRHFARADVARQAGLHAALAFPVVSDEGTEAVLEFFATERRGFDEQMLAPFEAVGRDLGRAVARLRRTEELREREGRFRALAETASDAIVTIDESDRIIYANAACERIFGYSLDELRAIPFTRLMPERFRQRHRDGMRRFVATGGRRLDWTGMEMPGLHRDGREIPLELTFGTFERDGRHFFSGIMRDISGRAEAEAERLRLLEAERQARGEAERRAQEEAALREAATAVSSAFTAEETIRRIANSALTATRADGAFVERICVGEGDVEVVATAGALVPPLGWRQAYRGSFAQRAVESEEAMVLPRLRDAACELPGDLRDHCADCAAAVIPLLNAGEPVGALVLIRENGDLGFRGDELERAATFGELASLAFRKIHLLEESERRADELTYVMESRSRLMRGFSHDVKNPLGAADGFLQLLEDGLFGPLTDDQLPKLRRARRALRSALDLIDDLLDFARAEAGQLDIKAAPTDVREAAREMAEDYTARATDKGLEIGIDVPDHFPVIESDPARVRQIAANLLSNAVKYTPAGGRVVVRVHADDEMLAAPRVYLAVSDTGPGIPPDKRNLLFEEFTRLDPEASDGAGVGLAISRRIAMALGGDILLESQVGEGSTFTLWLPLRRPGGTPSGDPAVEPGRRVRRRSLTG